jgi:uncharacterized protein (DUF2141 family)
MRVTAALALAFLLGLRIAPASAGDVTVAIEGVEEARGVVRVTLCTSAEYDSWACTLRQNIEAGVGSSSVSFGNVSPGQYAAKAYHDEDSDGELDRDLFGAPSEDYGFSRDARGTFGPPSFEDAAVYIGEEPVVLKVRLR